MRKTYCIASVLLLAYGLAAGQVVFQEQATALGITHLDDSRGCAIIDLENDGVNEIIIINKYGSNRLYKWNESSQLYDELGELYGIDSTVEHHNITVADIDKNLNPDLYITSHTGLPDARYYLNLGSPPFEDMAEQYNLDELFEMGSAFFQLAPQTGVSGLLGGKLMIREDDVYTDYTEGSGFEEINNQHCPLFFDIDGDNDDDVFLAGNHESNTGRLFRNNGDTTFTDISNNTDQGGFELGQGLAVGDIDNDGDFDFYLGSGFGYNSMWRNDGTGYFENITEWSNTSYAGYTRGICFGDFDNDTDLDIFVNRARDSNLLLLNDGTGQFTDISAEAGVDHVYNGVAAAIGDLNNDGQLDIVATNCVTDYEIFPTCVYINQNSNDNWLRVRLVGQNKNSLALSTNLKLWGISTNLTDTCLIGTRQISSHSGMNSVNELTAHFGTGEYTLLRLKVVFASGETVVVPSLYPGHSITIVEPNVGIDEVASLPEYYAAVTSYPNPFNATTTIKAYNFSNDNCAIKIYDVMGRLIKDDVMVSDTYTWNGNNNAGENVCSGVYLVRVSDDRNNTSATKITLLK